MEGTDFWGILSFTLSMVSDSLTIAVSSIAAYLFFFKKKPISDAFKALLNYSFHITLSELRAKLERLNDLNADDPDKKEQVVNILCEVLGQIRGNKRLRAEFPALLKTLTVFTNTPYKLNEHSKRGLVAELRESLNSINIADYAGG